MKPEIIDGFYVVGDEAYSEAEWAARERKRERDRRWRAEHPEAYNAIQRRWREANRERVREINRRSMRRRRGTPGPVVGSLHDLACTGPTRATGCVCRKIKCYAVEERAA